MWHNQQQLATTQILFAQQQCPCAVCKYFYKYKLLILIFLSFDFFFLIFSSFIYKINSTSRSHRIRFISSTFEIFSFFCIPFAFVFLKINQYEFHLFTVLFLYSFCLAAVPYCGGWLTRGLNALLFITYP